MDPGHIQQHTSPTEQQSATQTGAATAETLTRATVAPRRSGTDATTNQGDVLRSVQANRTHHNEAPPIPPRPKAGLGRQAGTVHPPPAVAPVGRGCRRTVVPKLFHILAVVPDVATFLAATNFDGCRWIGRLRYVSSGFDVFRVPGLWHRAEAPEEKLWPAFQAMLTTVGHHTRVLELTLVTNTGLINTLLQLCPNLHTLVSTSQFIPARHKKKQQQPRAGNALSPPPKPRTAVPTSRAAAHLQGLSNRVNADSNRLLRTSSTRVPSAHGYLTQKRPPNPDAAAGKLAASAEKDEKAVHIATFFEILCERAKRRRCVGGTSAGDAEGANRFSSGPESPGLGGATSNTALRSAVLLGYPGREGGVSGPFSTALVEFFVNNFQYFDVIVVGAEAVCRVLLRALQMLRGETIGQSDAALASTNSGGGTLAAAQMRPSCTKRSDRTSLGRLVQMCLDSLLEDYCANMQKKLRTHPQLELILRVNAAFSPFYPQIATSTFRVLSVMASKYMVTSKSIETLLIDVFLCYMEGTEQSAQETMPSTMHSNELLKMCLWTFLKISSRTIGDAFNQTSMSKNILRGFVVRGGVSLLIRRLRNRQKLSGDVAAAAAQAAATWDRPVVGEAIPDCDDDAFAFESDSLSPAKPYRSSAHYNEIESSGGGRFAAGKRHHKLQNDSGRRGFRTMQHIYRFGFAILHLVYIQIQKLLRTTRSATPAGQGGQRQHRDGTIAALKEEILDFVLEQTRDSFRYTTITADARHHNAANAGSAGGFHRASHLLRTDPHVRYHAGCIHRDLPNFTGGGDNLAHGCNAWKMNLKVGDIVDAQDSEEFTWWEAEIVSKYCEEDDASSDDDDGEDGMKGEHGDRPLQQPSPTLVSRISEAVPAVPQMLRDTAVAVGRMFTPTAQRQGLSRPRRRPPPPPPPPAIPNDERGQHGVHASSSSPSSGKPIAIVPRVNLPKSLDAHQRSSSIRQRRNTLIRVHFLGWNMKWNQWIDLRQHPQRIQPRNSMVVAWRRYLRAGSPVEACINKDRLGSLPQGMTVVEDPPPEVFDAGKWYHATVLEVRLSSVSRPGIRGGRDQTKVYAEITLGTGSSVRLWLDLQGNNIARPGTHRLGHLNRIAWCSCDNYATKADWSLGRGTDSSTTST